MNETTPHTTSIWYIAAAVFLFFVFGVWWYMKNTPPTSNEHALLHEEEQHETYDQDALRGGEENVAHEERFEEELFVPEESVSAGAVEEEVVSTETPTPPIPLVVNISSGMFFFEPNVIRARVGQPVVVNITSNGVHDFVIDALGVRAQTPNGQTTRVEFTPDTAGTFEFYCSVGSHRERGQRGTLVVE